MKNWVENRSHLFLKLMLAKDMVLAWAKIIIQACVSHFECYNFTSSNKIQCGLQYKQVVTE